MALASRQLFIGLMSGTSFDGIDVGSLETDGAVIAATGPAETWPWPDAMRERLRAVMGQANAPADLVRDVTDCHYAAVEAFLDRHAIDRASVAAVGFHGQTILHRPQDRLTVQIGDGAWLARALGLVVVDQFRIDDVAAGGQGAPLAPVYHQALFRQHAKPLAVVNIGGLSNVTWVGGDADDLVSFDCGIGNARLDDWMWRKAGLAYDADGSCGLRGTIDEALVAATLQQPYYQRMPPKSLDRDELFVDLPGDMGLDDGAATLAAITADAIVLGAQHFPAPVHEWIVAGGGRRNGAIMARLRAKLEQPVLSAEQAGQDGDGVEAHLIAFLAARKLAGLPSSYARTTGAPHPVVCGHVHTPPEA
jgi:anhydro-N-acetylmuramic acid kinase